MNSFELNKIMGAVLGTLLFVMGVGFIAEIVYHPIEGRGPGYPLPAPEVLETAAGPQEPAVPVSVLLASANVEAGAGSATRRCQSCHNFGEGEGHKAGPALYDVVGRPIAEWPDYAYSAALEQHGAAGETWTYEQLDDFLTNPQRFAPGSKMNLALRSDEERADILAYLQTLSPDPVPFPEPEEVVSEDVLVPEGEDVDVPPEPGGPESVVPTPTETQSDTPVQGTPTGAGTPAAVEDDAAPPAAPPAQPEPAPAADPAPAQPAPAQPAPAAPVQPAPATTPQ